MSSLKQHLDARYNDEDSAYRFATILLRLPSILKVAAYKKETLTTIAMFDLLKPHPLTMEISRKYAEISFF